MIGTRYTVLPSLFRFYNVQNSQNTRRTRISVQAATTPLGFNFSSALNVDNFERLGVLRRGDDRMSVEDVRIRDVKEVSYVSRRRMTDDVGFDADEVDDEGLPLVYNEAKITEFWRLRWGELASRWTIFAGISVPWITKLATAVIRGRLEQQQEQLAREAVQNLERLGPTFVKLGQVLSIRPDVLPPPVMKELAKLQDDIAPFPTSQARAVIEAELGQPISVLFSDFSEKPIAAASLAQVYRARLASTGEEVAVKVQRPSALSIISKDLYVMRRAVVLYERLIRRFTAQTTDYQILLSTFAEGLYTEMDFRNEALNALRMKELLKQSEFVDSEAIVIPEPNLALTTRRVLTMEFIRGSKLSLLPPDEIRRLVKVGQDAFLVQLLEIGFFHSDPHPGNLLKVTEGPNAGKLALIDFGLVSELPASDREAMVSATIHLGNRDWNALITDFIALGFLPIDSDRGLIIPVMEKVLSPYLRGGGAKAFNFQMLSQDLLQASLQIPFSVPPYMSLLARAVATLEGIALVGDPGYQMVAQAYPFVVRKVLRDSSRGGARMLLREMLFDASGTVKPARMSAVLNAALGYVAEQTDGFVDFDAVPAEGAPLQDIVAFLLSPEARQLRPLLLGELVDGADLLVRDQLRRAYARLPALAPRLPLLGALPTLPPPPVLVPGRGFMSMGQVVEAVAPELDRSEEVYLQSVLQLIVSVSGINFTDMRLDRLLQMLLNPSEQMTELRQSFAAASANRANAQVITEMVESMVVTLMDRFSARLGVPTSTLFPGYPAMRKLVFSAAAN